MINYLKKIFCVIHDMNVECLLDGFCFIGIGLNTDTNPSKIVQNV